QGLAFLTILATGLVSVVVKAGPILALARRRLPAAVLDVGRYLPVAVLSAMAFSGVFAPEGALDFSPGNVFVVAAVPTVAVAFLTRQMFPTIITGVATVAILRAFFY
ncbi:MAG TPA: AzlD domain-containing protein, partial [Alphaproteobacteria bacterium]|nr:AzlD domain-containing protein [Alphaproteobacteria bacterium]